MKQIIKKGSFLTLMFLLLGCLSLYAADNDLITKQITIELEKAGTLPDRISSSKMYKITNLKIIGEINGTDLSMIREMAGGNYSDGKLSVLDLSEAKIVEGGDSYYVNDLHNYYSTSNDVIGSFAFQGCRRLTSLTLPAGITSICEGAFWGCRELTSLTLPAGITWIEFSAFDGCSGLKEVRFCINDNLDTYLTKGQTPWSVLMGKQPTVANPYKKVNCGIKYYINDKEITSIEIPSNVTTLSNYVFQGCSGLTSLTLPAGITEIGDYAFWGCSGLTSLNLPAGITEIGEGTFYGCSGLTSLNLPAGITWIGYEAFSGCSGLTSLNLPAGITSIGWKAFEGCSGLTSLNLPAGITEIGSSAFEGCSGLTSLNLPAGITEIGNDTFSGCRGLTSLTLPAGITEIGDGAFGGCRGLTSLNLPAGITKIGDYAFGSCSGLTSLTLPAGITEIGKGAFDYCSGLTSLNLPAGITKIGDGAFRGCSGLTSIYVYAEKVPEKGYRYDVFERVDAKKCTLYVPMGTYDDYRLSYFGHYFENIVEFDATGIDKTTTSTDVEEVARYSVNGQRLSAPTKGLNIVKYSDGSVKKVAVQ